MSIKGILDYYFSSFIRECNQKKLKTIDSYITKFFKTNNFKLKKLINFEGIPIPIITAEKDVKNYMDFVFRLPQEIYNKNSEKIKGIIIIIDEFQVIKDIGNYLDSFLWNFRGYVSEQRNVAYVLSGSMSLQDNLISQISGRNGAFGGRMLTINISPFSKTTTEKYLKEKASEIKFSEDGFKRFYKCTSGIPSYINIFARQLSTSYLLKEKDIIDAFDNNISIIAVHLINEWNRLTIKEKDIIIALIDKPLKRIEIANKLNVKSGSLSDKLNKLQNLGLIGFYDGKYRIIEELLKRWLKTEYREKGIYPYRVI